MASEARMPPVTRPARSSRPRCCLSKEHAFQLVSALVLPLLLGAFTVLITFQQQNTAREQWLEDRTMSKEQRQQELLIANGQREDLREESKNRYKEELLFDFFKEMGELLRECNGALTSNPVTSALARVKTLNTFRQLEGKRAILMLRFLYETRQLTDTDTSTALNISKATVTEMDISALETIPDIGPLLLPGIILKNSTFDNGVVENVDFTSVRLTTVTFSSVWVGTVIFSSARLDTVNFSPAKLFTVNFSAARLLVVNFSAAALDTVDFSSAYLYTVNFSAATLHTVDFSSAWLHTVAFSSAYLFTVNFSSARLGNLHSLTFSAIEPLLDFHSRSSSFPSCTCQLLRTGVPQPA